MYFIATSGFSPHTHLYELICDIHILELELGIVLLVFHIPGVVIITQGTDSLSQGIWMSILHTIMDKRTMLLAIFAPTTFDVSFITLICKFLPEATSTCTYYN